MRITLNLVPAKTPYRDAVAWFVTGPDPQVWLRVLDQLELPLESLHLCPIPRSLHDRNPLGALVTSRQPASQSVTYSSPTKSNSIRSRWQPYACVACRLYVPIDADFAPGVTDDELLSLLPSVDSDFIWHPSAGLVRIDADERLGVVDLLVAPTEHHSIWDRAVTGTSFRSRILAIASDEPLTADEVMQRAAPDIGSQNSSLDQLPPTPDELFGGKLYQWTKPLRDAVRSMVSRPKPKEPPEGNSGAKPTGQGGTPTGRGQGPVGIVANAASALAKGLRTMLAPVGALGAGIGKVLSRVGAMPFIDQMARNREIDRLMHLLKTDPDAGLRFALPMGQGDSGRGVANPSNQLAPHDIGFNLNRLAGGSPADLWSVPPDQQLALIQQYRELAARELRLGRHRRAAYIFAELLGDFVSAAGALEAGHHYRDAAVLYRDRLKRPVDAAKCLERAGLLDEAALMYVDLGLFEQAADLYVRLEREDEAERLLRAWVEHLIGNGDFRTACRILHDKLHDVDGALVTLMVGWPNSASALWCVEESFRLLGQHARHDDALRLISDLRSTPLNSASTILLARAVSKVAIDYPEKPVRVVAGDATRIVVAGALPRSTSAEITELLGTVRRLAPQDRLLGRDCDRYVRNRHDASGSKSKLRHKSQGISLVSSTKLSLDQMSWRVAKSTGKTAYVAGYGGSSLVVQRLYWDAVAQPGHRAFWASVSDARPLILEPFPGDAGGLIVHPIGVDPINQRGLRQNDGRTTMAGSPSWATKSTVAMAYAEGGFCWRIRVIFGTLEIACISPKAEPLIVKDLAIPFDSQMAESTRITLSVINKRIRVGIGPYLCRPNSEWSNQAEVWTMTHSTFASEIQTLLSSQVGGQPWLIVLFETGGVLVDDDDYDLVFPIAEELESVCATFLTDGRFIVAGVGEAQAYQIANGRPQLIGRYPLDTRPISVTTTNKLNEFAIFGAEGIVKILSLDRGSQPVNSDY